ncbi:DoxX family protein [Streptomyces sp. NPDC003016]
MTSSAGQQPPSSHPDADIGPPDPAAPPVGRRGARAALDVMRDGYRPHSTTVLRVSVGLVFVWFGVMKFFPGTSPAESVAIRTMDVLTFDLLSTKVSYLMLAFLETAIGAGLVTGVFLRLALTAFFAHMAGVFSALFILPAEMWNGAVPAPTLEGQYIIKNVVLVAACLAVAVDERRTRRHRSPRD